MKNEKSDRCVVFERPNTPALLSQDTATLTVLAELLGGGRSALLMERLRYENGLIYFIGAENHPSSDSGEFVIRTSAKNTDVSRVLEIINDEILKVISGNISDDNFEFAKEKHLKSRMMNMETSRAWVFEHSFGLLCDPSYS